MLKKRGVVPNPVGTFETRLNVAFRQLGLFTFFEIRNPLIYFFFRQMQTRGVKILPGSKGIQSEPLSLLFSLDILLNGFAHHPMCRSTPRQSELLHSFLYS